VEVGILELHIYFCPGGAGRQREKKKKK